MLTVGSLFSGIGGLDLGLERAGMKVLWQVEIDPYASRVLAKHWPDVPNLGDVRDIDWSRVAAVDLVCGGFPCQPVSAAGKQKAQADERWLWPEFNRCLRHLRPRFVVVENVPTLVTVAGGRAAQEVFGDLAGLGYDAEWGRLSAAQFGAPHLRRRIFVVAHTRGERQPQRTERNGATHPGIEAPLGHDIVGLRTDVADTDQGRRGGRARFFGEGWWSETEDGRGWEPEPDVGRVVNGLPSRVDRLRCLGNAVVPQVAEWIGRRLLEVFEVEA